ncbi:MAG: glycosyltransferase [bacterium]
MWSSWRRFWTVEDSRSQGARLVLKGAVEGLRLNGKEVREFLIQTDDPELPRRIREDIARYQPDVLLLANHPAALFLKQAGISEPPCPCLVWLFDDPAIMGAERFGGDEIVLASDPGFIEGARKRGARRIYFVPVAAPDTAAVERREVYAAPLAYVGSASMHDRARKSMTPEIERYLDEIIRRKVENPERNFTKLMEEHPLAPNKQIRLTGPLSYFLYTDANRLYRLRFLEALAPLGLRLYGGASWIPQIHGTELEPCFQGGIDSLTEYPHVIHSVDINLNIRSLQGFTAPVHRDFLVPRLGGFLLSTAPQKSSFQWKWADPRNWFHLDQLVWSPACGDPQSMVETVRRYLENPALRTEWTERASRTIAEHHTYANRMQQLGALLDAAG